MVVKNTTEEEEAPNGFLYALEIENFKSFKSKHYIGPFRDFTAIIGPNGSGKSNLMDAISFVLGERSNNLRVRKLGDLIHGASVEKAEVNKCRVSMIFALDREDRENGPKKAFTRSVVSSTASEFRIDNEVVTPNDYRKALEEIYIFIKAKNFLVYQGAVERVAMQTPKEMTQLFEELSRSAELKADYEKAKADLQAAESNAQTNMVKRRDIAMEKREARLERDEARKYQMLKDELAAKNKELYLVQLYFVEHSRSNAQSQLEVLKDQVEEIRKSKTEFEERVAEKQAVVKNLSREIQKLDQKITKEERKYASQEPLCNQLKQKIEHIKTKLTSVDKAHKAAQKVAEEYDHKMAETEERMSEFRKQMEALESQIQRESQKMELNLNPEQVTEYRRLKGEVEKRGNIISVELDNKNQEQETDRNAVEYEKRRLANYLERIKQKEQEIAREKKNMENLKESEEAQRQLIETETQNLRTMEQEVRSAKERLTEVSIQLEEITKQISDAQGDSAETERNRRQNEAIENLKRVFPDRVHGRLIELCQPSHRRFQVAVTKVLGKFMVAIVCDTDDTARECITYLREQHYPPETFLPLNSLDVMPINEKLRDIKDPPNVKLLYDVIQCNYPPAKKALQFVCSNSLVCDDPEHARALAYGGGDSRDRYRAVSLDGTQFQPNGVISGGGHDLKVRAKRWDEHQMKKLRDKRADVLEEYNHLHRTRRRELDVEMKRNQIAQIEQRVRFTQNEYKRISDHLERLSRELDSEQGEIEHCQSKIETREAEMKKRLVEIKKFEEQNNQIADEVFADFCSRIGIRHIREYEQREMRIHEENEQKINACRRELQRLQYEMDFLKSEDRKAAVKKEEDKLKQLRSELDNARDEYKKENEKLDAIQQAMDELKREVMEKRREIEEAEAEVATVKKDGADIDKQLHQVEKNLIQQEQIVSRRAQKRHSLLQECKLHGIEIPLTSGTLDTILLTDEFSSIDDSQPSTSQQSLSQSQQSSQLSQTNAEEIVVNYSSLKGPTKTYQNEADVKKITEKLTKAVQETEATLSKMAAPNTHVDQRMEIVREKEVETTEECEQARRKMRKARVTFEKVKTDRLKRFQDFFDPVSAKIDEIYKALSQNESAQAFLGPENSEEPYNGGISYNCIAPGKRFRPMDNLSGGEKTIAALALLFAIHSSNPSPFFVLDEIDAALDNTNIGKVVSYIGERSKGDLQIIVISLKEEMYNKSNALIGVYPRSTVPCIASGILSYDLDQLENQ